MYTPHSIFPVRLVHSKSSTGFVSDNNKVTFVIRNMQLKIIEGHFISTRTKSTKKDHVEKLDNPNLHQLITGR